MNPNLAKTDADTDGFARVEMWRLRDAETPRNTEASQNAKSGAENSAEAFANDPRGDFSREQKMLNENFLSDEKMRDFVGINIVAEEIVDPRMELSDAETTENTGANSAQIAERRAAEE